MEKSWRCQSENELLAIAKELLQSFPNIRKFAFYGEMGAGKTTFAKSLCEALQVQDVVSSPTFSIVNEYLSEQNGTVFHFDFYRLKDEKEAFDMGYEDYFYSDGLWEEFIKYHTSQEFFKEVVELFGEDVIKKYHPSLNKKFPNLMKSPVKIRDKSDTSVAIPLDVQPGINSPVTEESSVIGPHVDNKKEIYAGLLYMRLDEDDSEGGDLEIYRHLDDIPLTEKFDRKARPSLDKLELVDTVPYRKNMFALFINSNVSFHGVTPRQITEHNRRLVNIIAEKK